MTRLLTRIPRWIAAAASAIALSILPTAVHAQFGFGLGFGPQIVFDPSAVGKLVDQLARQAEHIAVSRDQLQQQVIALRKLSSPPWRDITVAMAQIDALTRQ